jgi:CDP-glucose 4,6-dehydratase
MYLCHVDFQELKHLKALQGPVLVTGHTGFKGTWLTLILEKLGIEVVGFSLAAESNNLFQKLGRAEKIFETFSDLRNADEISKFIKQVKPSIVFHLAAQPLVLDSYINPSETFEVNVMGAVNLFEACKDTPSLKAILTTTTDKVYSNLNLDNRFKETDPLFGKDPYSASKVAVENVISAYSNIFAQDTDVRITSLRSGNVIGGGDISKNRLVPDLVKAFSSKSKAQIRNPKSTRPWQHVLDPLHGYLLSAEALLSGETFKAINFGPTDRSLTVEEVSQISTKTWGATAEYIVVQENSELESKTLELDSSFARKILDWQPMWSQEESVVRSIAWWKVTFDNKISFLEATENDLEVLLVTKLGLK